MISLFSFPQFLPVARFSSFGAAVLLYGLSPCQMVGLCRVQFGLAAPVLKVATRNAKRQEGGDLWMVYRMAEL